MMFTDSLWNEQIIYKLQYRWHTENLQGIDEIKGNRKPDKFSTIFSKGDDMKAIFAFL